MKNFNIFAIILFVATNLSYGYSSQFGNLLDNIDNYKIIEVISETPIEEIISASNEQTTEKQKEFLQRISNQKEYCRDLKKMQKMLHPYLRHLSGRDQIIIETQVRTNLDRCYDGIKNIRAEMKAPRSKLRGI